MKSLGDYQPYRTMFVDGMNLLSRSHYGMPSLEFNGRKTGMFMGVARLVIDWRKKNPGLRIIFIWEGRDSWRKEKYPIYKANRKKDYTDREASKEFFRNVAHVQDSLPVMGVDQVSSHTYEADDTVWTVMNQEAGRKLFVSTDWDWWTLVEHGDILYQDIVMTEEDLQKKFAAKFNCDPIPMKRMWLFKALTGDPSDGVSGIPRFPKKLAARLSADMDVDSDNIATALIRYGVPRWADRVNQNKWILDRNLELISPKIPVISELRWAMGDYNAAGFEDVLLKSGMSHLHDKLIGDES